MATHDYVIANGTGAAVRTDLNSALQAILTNNSGNSAPATTAAGMFWWDSDDSKLYVRNSADSAWILVTTAEQLVTATVATSLSFPDNAALFMGTGNDLKIFHNGGNSQINDLSTGNLQLLSNGAGVDIMKTDGEYMARFYTDDRVDLYHDNAVKLTTSAAGILLPNGTMAAPSLAFVGDTNTGITNNGAASNFYVSVDGVFRLAISGSAVNCGMDGSAGTAALSFNSDWDTGLFHPAANVLAVTTAGAERLRVAADGRIAISHSSPDSESLVDLGAGENSGFTRKVTVVNTGNSRWGLGAASNEARLFYADDQDMRWKTLSRDGNFTASEKMVLTRAGDLGVGTSAPNALIEAAKDADGANVVISVTNENTSGDGNEGAGFWMYEAASMKSAITSNFQTNQLNIYHEGANAIVIDSSSKVGVGVSAPNAQIDVNGDIKSRSGIQADQQGSCAFGYQFSGWRAVSWGADASTRGIYRFEQYEGDAGGAIVSQSASTAGVWSADYTDTSDRNLKKNIVPIPAAVDVVKALNPVNFDWKLESKGSNSGFIAQELQEILPDEVSGTPYDPDSEFPDTAMSINVTGIVAHLTRALQESMEKIETLEARVAALEGA